MCARLGFDFWRFVFVGMRCRDRHVLHDARVTCVASALWCVCTRNRAWGAQAVEIDDALATEEAAESRDGVFGEDAATAMPTGSMFAMRKARRGHNDHLSSKLQMAKKPSHSMFSGGKSS